MEHFNSKNDLLTEVLFLVVSPPPDLLWLLFCDMKEESGLKVLKITRDYNISSKNIGCFTKKIVSFVIYWMFEKKIDIISYS